MSTTVTYKGQTLTTVENQTKTLQTAGTWVEGDFTLTDVTQGGGVTPTGFVEEYAYTVESAIAASNNSTTVLNEVCPATLDETDYNCYLFFVTNNTASQKRALFALCQRTGTGNSRTITACRWQSATEIRWASAGAFDWWFSAGSVIHVLKFNSLLGAE